MSRLPNLARPRVEDYAAAPDWFKRFIGNITNFFETVYYALSGDLTFGENISAEYRDFTQNSNQFPIIFQKTKSNKKVKAIFLAQVVDYVSPESPLSISPVMTWVETSGGIKINVSGLLPNVKYSIKVLIIY